MIKISTITPVFAGQDFLNDLVNNINDLRIRIEKNSEQLRLIESIFVVDGAIDSSEEILHEIQKKHTWIRVITLSKNFGQHNATVAGILYSSGDWIVTLDEDLQHPPEKILDILSTAANEQADVVYAVPKQGSHGNSYRDKFSRLAKRLIGLLSRNRFLTAFSSFRVIRGQVARAAASVCSNQTYFDIVLAWFTSRIVSVPIQLNDQRFTEGGSSGYSFFTLLSHAKKLIISSDLHLFKVSIFIGTISVVCTISLGAWVLYSYYMDPLISTARGWASLMSVILFYGGVILLLLGLIFEIVKIIMFHGLGKPTFFVVNRESDKKLKSELDVILNSKR